MTENAFKTGAMFADRYRVDKVLGQGSIATVYLAHDLRLGVDRAVKVLHKRIVAVPNVGQRFLSEVQSAVHLDHPNAVRLFEIGKDDKIVSGTETLFVTMELVAGGSLADYLRERGPMPQSSALLAIRGVLRALQRAHGKGILHREVKPSNILIGKGGVPKLADFGFARVLEIPGVREAIVTPPSSYLSPEQRTGSRPATLQSDIYGAGATLYSLVTGKDAVGLDDPVVRVRLLREVDEPSCDIVDRATQPDPGERYASTTEFLDAIEAASAAVGQAQFTDQGVDVAAQGAPHASADDGEGPFEAPPDLAGELDDPLTDPSAGRSPSSVIGTPPIVLEHAPAHQEGDDEPDTADVFDVRQLGLPLRQDDGDPDGAGPYDKADDIAASIRTQRAAAPAVPATSEPDDPRKKLMAIVAVIAVFLCLSLLVMLRDGGEIPLPAVAVSPKTTGAAAVAGPQLKASVEAVKAPDPTAWRPPRNTEKVAARIQSAPWM